MRIKALGFVLLLGLIIWPVIIHGQDYDVGGGDSGETPATPALPEQNKCNGILVTYTFVSREKEFPRLKNVSAQPWAFKAQASVLNAGDEELRAWKIFVGFQHREILVSADGAVVIPADDGVFSVAGGGQFPVGVGNGTYLSGSDLKTAIDTAGDLDQIEARVSITGTMFGLKTGAVPMPKKLRLENDGYDCPPAKIHGKSSMYVCCTSDPKFKAKKAKATKFSPRQNGDLSITYDVLQAYSENYLGQVTLDNNHALGRLDHWNLTWEWARGEFINTMRGAYAHKHDASPCINGPAGTYYTGLDFSQVMSCDKRPIISDLPADRKDDEKIGKLPYCCRNGSLLPGLMDEKKARSIFQLQVYKVPPDLNRTALFPPRNWAIEGVLNPDYKCGAPIRVDPTEFLDPSGLQAVTLAIASWQITCNISRPSLKRRSKCCVSFSAFYNDSVVPCETCACGCGSEENGSGFGLPGQPSCDPGARALLLPAEALLVPFVNRSEKARAWARLKHWRVPAKLPCPDNCGVTINWHVNADYRKGWTARITLFNWMEEAFEDWFSAVEMGRAYEGYENVYSFNGTRIPELDGTVFFRGLPGLNYLVGETNGTRGVRVPGKQQSVMSFSKKRTPGINVQRGDGFPTKVYFNGEECDLPKHFPTKSSGNRSGRPDFLLPVLFSVVVYIVMVVQGLN